MKTIKVMVILLMLVFSLVPATMIVKGAGPNFMGFVLSPKDVTVGASFTTLVWVNVGSAIDTASVDNLTYLPAGKVSYVSTAQGNLFAGSLVWITPESGGVIDNTHGYANPITWAYTVSVNGVNRTLGTITWSAVKCAIVTTTITAGGTALAGIDPGTTKYTGTIRVHPMTTTAFDAEPGSPTLINLDWTKQTGDDRVLIRYKSGSNPTSVTDGTLLYNSTGTSTTQTVAPGEHVYYSAWGYNTTANLYSQSYQTDDAITNQQPTFGTTSPINGSIDRNIAFSWSIPINDPEGDVFNWNIACSNGQSSNANGASNGTKSLSILGLAYSTTYTVWVNATDPAGSGLWTRAWYDFTTKANFAPTFGTPSPTNGLTGQNLALTWSIPISDPDGNLFDFRISCSNGEWTDVAGAVNGTKSLSISGLSYNTNYTVWVNATDPYPPGSGIWTRKAYTFVTKLDTRPNEPTNPLPANLATNVKPNIKKLQCTVTDPDGDHMNVQFYWANGTLIGTDTNVASGGTAEISIPTLNELTTYRWYVNASDGLLASVGPLGAPGTNWSFTTGKLVTGGGGEVFDQLSISTLFNGMPLDGAIILIYQGVGTQAVSVFAQAVSSANKLQVFNLPDGTYTIHVAKAGYQEQTRTITLVHATALSGTTMTVIFNLQQLGAVDYTMLAGVFFLLVIGFLLAYTVVKDKTYLGPSMTQLIVLLLDVAAIVVGIYYFWVMAIVGAALLVIEIIWMRWAK